MYRTELCVEQYANLEAHEENVEYLEKNFPAYSENTECEQKCEWGSVKLGRLPEFLYTDASRLREEDSGIEWKGPDEEAAQYKAQFWSAFQYFQDQSDVEGGFSTRAG